MEAGVNLLGRAGCRYTKEHVWKISGQYIHFRRSYDSFCKVRTFVLIYRPHPVDDLLLGSQQSMNWTGSIRWINNTDHSFRIWIGLDQTFANSTDSGLDWIDKFTLCILYLEN